MGETLEGDNAALELIKGYKKVTEITPIFILYPSNGPHTQTKLVYGTREAERKAQQHLTITANGEGDVTVVANHITYNIHVHNSQLNMRKGEKKFFAGYDISACTSQAPNVATVEAYTQKVPSLFDCLESANNSLSVYSTEANSDIDMSGAEFIFTSVDDADDQRYTIQNAADDQYLINEPNAKYFGTTPIHHQVTRVEDSTGGAEVFEIQRQGNASMNGRYIFFYYVKMGLSVRCRPN